MTRLCRDTSRSSLLHIFSLVVSLEKGLLGVGPLPSLLASEFDGLLEGLVDSGELGLGHELRVLANGGVHLLVEILQFVGIYVVGHVLGEVLLEHLLVVFLQLTHVVRHVLSKDTSLVGLGIELLGVSRVSRESLLGVGNVQTAIRGTLHGAEDASTSGGVLGADIEKGTEGASLVINLLHVVDLSVVLGGDGGTLHFLHAGVDLVQSDLLEQASGHKETRAVGSRVVLQPDRQAVSGKLTRVSLAEDLVTVNLGIHNLAQDVFVGQAHDKSVLGGLVFVLVLSDKLVSLAVVSLTLCIREVHYIYIFTMTIESSVHCMNTLSTCPNILRTSAPAELHLEALEILLCLLNLNEWLEIYILHNYSQPNNNAYHFQT